MKKLISVTAALLITSSAMFASEAIDTNSSKSHSSPKAQLESISITPFVGIVEGGKALSGVKTSFMADDGWSVELEAALRENNPGNTDQDWQVFFGFKKDILKIAGIESSVGAGLGHIHTDKHSNLPYSGPTDITPRLSIGNLYKINSRGDGIRVDLNAQFDRGETEMNVMVGYSINIGFKEPNPNKFYIYPPVSNETVAVN